MFIQTWDKLVDMHAQIRKTFGSSLLSIVASSILCPPLDQCHDWTEQGDAAPFEYEAGAACHDNQVCTRPQLQEANGSAVIMSVLPVQVTSSSSGSGLKQF